MRITVADAPELVHDDRFHRLPEHAVGRVVLGQHADERVDVVDVPVEGLEFGVGGVVRGDMTEVGEGGQTESHPDGVVVRYSVVPAALDVDGAQVGSESSWDAEQLVTQVVAEEQVVGWLRVGCQATQKRVDAALVGDGGGDPEAVLEFQVARRDR